MVRICPERHRCLPILAPALLLAISMDFASPRPYSARAASGRLDLTVVDRESGEPIPCRMHLKNKAGRARRVDGVPFWEDHFVFDGTISLTLPLGDYTFELERGP